jgi:prepilin-type N-terminal cleavage/methylation domain-containing protein
VRRRRDESGYTLIETMVVMIVMSIILTFVYQVLISTQRTTFAANVRLENLEEARVLMATITKDLRTAARLSPTTSPFVQPTTADEVTFYAYLNTFTEPVRVHIYVDASDRIVEEILRPPYTGTPEIRVVGRYVAEEDVFTYFPADDPDTAVQEPALVLPLDAEELKQIEAVEVNLSIRKTTNASMTPTTLINRVRLPNVDYQPIDE